MKVAVVTISYCRDLEVAACMLRFIGTDCAAVARAKL